MLPFFRAALPQESFTNAVNSDLCSTASLWHGVC